MLERRFVLATENLTNFTGNNLCELVRGIAGNLVEEVKLIDEFHNLKTGKTSNCFRISISIHGTFSY